MQRKRPVPSVSLRFKFFHPTESRRHLTLIIIALTAFVFLGLPGGLRNVTWPSISDMAGVSLGELGTLVVAISIGYISSSALSGYALSRLGFGTLITLAAALMAVSLLGFAFVTAWPLLLLFGFLGGLGGGTIDPALNTYVSTHYSLRTLNWLHGAFGIGAAAGPLMMTQLLAMNRPWQDGYRLAAGLLIAFGILLAFVRGSWRSLAPPSSDQVAPQKAATSGETLRLPIVWLSILFFFVYVGLEIGTGDWAFALFHESRGVAEATATLWVGIYWGAFTIGRFGFGAWMGRFNINHLLRAMFTLAIIGTALIWGNFSNTVSFIGLVMLGLSLAPMFPLVIAANQERMGAQHVANAVGFQIAGAVLGSAIMVRIQGFLVDAIDLETIGPFLFALAIGQFAIHELLIAHDRRRTLRVQPAVADAP